MDALPHWEPGTAAVLCVPGPHAIPVSTAIRSGDRRVLLALGRRRETLERLREDAGAALCVMAEGLAFTAGGRAAVVRAPLRAQPSAVALELVVERLTDHLADGRTEMLGPPGWRWRDDAARAAEPEILSELLELAAELRDGPPAG
ncbi:MAG TPA: hypothetical protein VFD31_09315 [Thermoleophilaceae bacterium]|nr:hypothetical protein [Thermoleophilaceae bacterium]